MTREQREAFAQYIEDLLFDISLLAQSGMSPEEQKTYFEKERRRALELIVRRTAPTKRAPKRMAY